MLGAAIAVRPLNLPVQPVVHDLGWKPWLAPARLSGLVRGLRIHALCSNWILNAGYGMKRSHVVGTLRASGSHRIKVAN